MPVGQKLAAFVLATAGLAAGLTASAPALGDEAPPVAVAARLANDGEAAKLVFDLSARSRRRVALRRRRQRIDDAETTRMR